MAVRAGVLLLSAIGLSATLFLAYLGWLADAGTKPALEEAARLPLAPARVHEMLAEADPARSAEHWGRSAALAPGRAAPRLHLALAAEAEGAISDAEEQLKATARQDATYAPAWALTNFYFRQRRWDEFWAWARKGADVHRGDIGALLDLCLRADPDPQQAMERLNLRRPGARLQLLRAAARHELLNHALPVASMVARDPTAGARDALLDAVDRLLVGGEAELAHRYWNLSQPAHRAGRLFNSSFSTPPLGRGFDWRLRNARWSHAPGIGLRVTFEAPGEDAVPLIEQVVLLEAPGGYELNWRARGQFGAGSAPPRWQAGASLSQTVGGPDWAEQTWRFTVSKPGSLWLRLIARREPGWRRPSGSVELDWVRLAPLGHPPKGLAGRTGAASAELASEAR